MYFGSGFKGSPKGMPSAKVQRFNGMKIQKFEEVEAWQ